MTAAAAVAIAGALLTHALLIAPMRERERVLLEERTELQAQLARHTQEIQQLRSEVRALRETQETDPTPPD